LELETSAFGGQHHPSTDCGLCGRVHPQIAWAKLRADAAIASKKLWS